MHSIGLPERLKLLTIKSIDSLDELDQSIFSSKKWLDLIGLPYRLWGVYKGQELVGGVVDCETLDVKLTPYHGLIVKEKSQEYAIAKVVADMSNLKLVNHYSIRDMRPFLWKGYKPALRYTYIANGLEFEKDTRYEINKAIHGGFEVLNGTIEQFWAIYKKTFERKCMSTPVDYDWFQKFNEVMQPKIYMVDDIAGAVIISDAHRDYYIFGASTKEAQNTGASSLVLSHAISKTNEMDLVGCNNESVGLFKRGFAKELKVCLGIELQ